MKENKNDNLINPKNYISVIGIIIIVASTSITNIHYYTDVTDIFLEMCKFNYIDIIHVLVFHSDSSSSHNHDIQGNGISINKSYNTQEKIF